jgi:hypothetical protein
VTSSKARFERAELPADGTPIRYYPPKESALGRDGPLLRMFRRDGSSWLCMFASEKGDLQEPLVMPDGRYVYSCGCLVSVDDPSDWSEVEVSPVRGCAWSPSRDVVLFHDYSRLAAYGHDGLMWRSDDLVTDDLEIAEVTGETVTVRGYMPYVTDDVLSDAIELHLKNGKRLKEFNHDRGSLDAR